jgi:TadE-like protein
MNGNDPMSLMIRQAIRSFLVGEDGIAGSAIVEFTLVAPLLVVMSIYTMDFGVHFYNQMQVQNAAQAAVDWAIANHITGPAMTAGATQNGTYIIGSQNNPAISFPTDTLNPNPIVRCGCPSSSGVSFTTTNNPAPALCPPCGGGLEGLYVTVQTQATYTPLASYGLFSSGTRTLTAQATTRIQ